MITQDSGFPIKSKCGFGFSLRLFVGKTSFDDLLDRIRIFYIIASKVVKYDEDFV